MDKTKNKHFEILIEWNTLMQIFSMHKVHGQHEYLTPGLLFVSCSLVQSIPCQGW